MAEVGYEWQDGLHKVAERFPGPGYPHKIEGVFDSVTDKQLYDGFCRGFGAVMLTEPELGLLTFNYCDFDVIVRFNPAEAAQVPTCNAADDKCHRPHAKPLSADEQKSWGKVLDVIHGVQRAQSRSEPCNPQEPNGDRVYSIRFINDTLQRYVVVTSC